MKFLRELLAVLRVNLSGVPHRIGSALTIVVGVACAVGALVSMLAMGTGAREQQVANVRPDRVVLTTQGTGPAQGNITKQEAAVILGLPGVRRDAAGAPIVVFQSMVQIEGRRRATGNRIYFPLVGVTAAITDFAPELRFTAGRTFKSGLPELIASNACNRQFAGFELGDQRSLRGGDWSVVGHFDQGPAQDCTVYADAETLMSAFGRTTYSSAALMLQSPADFDALRTAVSTDPRLKLDVRREQDAIQDAFKPLNAILNFVSYFIGAIMAIGATLGAVNSLYAMVDSRQREIGTLRAIGFNRGPVIAAVLLESMLLSLPGALLGSGLAWLLFNGLAASPFGYSFQLSVTFSLALLGTQWALAMGLLGGLLPALRAARMPVVTALRAL
ncbi:ABC transporter permease [Steroidobacter sp.]|uniref:ABC transporter permease n=1 Tax=Steroidobacter sp. TaxID=1978227 RepID=UPI001A41DC3C|nr:ABC transporter permease [Steroidobacter sp.]MBL8266744.1 ABC transporter permease [Steroidobacter sp.]